MNGKNRRRHTRVRARNVAAHLRVEDQASICQVEDISRGGLFVRTDQRLPIGLPVVIDLARPGLKKPLRVTGVVAQHSDARHGIGVSFDPLDRESEARLGEILRDLGAYAPPPAPAPAPVGAAAAAPTPVATGTTTGTTANPFAKSTPTATMPADENRLLIQIKGLMMELGTREQTLSQAERELAAAKDEIERLKHELRRKDDHLYALEQKLRAEAQAAADHAARVVEILKSR